MAEKLRSHLWVYTAIHALRMERNMSLSEGNICLIQNGIFGFRSSCNWYMSQTLLWSYLRFSLHSTMRLNLWIFLKTCTVWYSFQTVFLTNALISDYFDHIGSPLTFTVQLIYRYGFDILTFSVCFLTHCDNERLLLVWNYASNIFFSLVFLFTVN